MKNSYLKKLPLLRKLTQWLALLGSNAWLPGFFQGRVYAGRLKSVCLPGLNCYSCPGAVTSCPLGALQAVLGASGYRFSFYAAGLLLGFGVLFGRFVCGFLCPFGLIQELLHKIPFPRVKKFPRFFLSVKYFLLVVFVFALPVFARNFADLGDPAFCKYICPAGTLTGGLPLLAANPSLRQAAGNLFAWKATLAAVTVLGCLAVYRFFCRALCPLGALYGLFNKISFCRIHLEKTKCVRCGACAQACKMEIDPGRAPGSPECIRCGDCVRVCRFSALRADFLPGGARK